MNPRIQALNVEIKKLKDQVSKVHLMLEPENFQYNLLESQFEQLRMRNDQLKKDNEQAQAQVAEAMNAAAKIRMDADDYDKSKKADIAVRYHKAQSRFKELEESFTKAERKQIDSHLKEVEALVA